MTIENDLTRIASALDLIAVTLTHMTKFAAPVGQLRAPTPEDDEDEATYVVSTPTPAAAPTPAPIPAPETPAAPAAPARVRRTKAQIEADKQAEAQRILAAMQAQVAPAASPVTVAPTVALTVAPTVVPAAATPAPGPTFTLADFRPRFVKLADAGKRDALIELIGTLGGKMLTDIKPDQYGALHAGLVKLEGGHV